MSPWSSDPACVKWSAAVHMCYCPFKTGRETLAEVNESFPEGRELDGFGDGCTYWHGKLVPDTRVGKFEWLFLGGGSVMSSGSGVTPRGSLADCPIGATWLAGLSRRCVYVCIVDVVAAVLLIVSRRQVLVILATDKTLTYEAR